MPIHMTQSAVVYLIIMLVVIVVGLLIVTKGKVVLVVQGEKLSKLFDQGAVKLVGDISGEFPQEKVQFEYEQSGDRYIIKSIILKSAAFNYEGPEDKMDFSIMLDLGDAVILGKDMTKEDEKKHVFSCEERDGGMQCESPRDVYFFIPHNYDPEFEGRDYLHFTVWRAKTVPVFCLQRQLTCIDENGYYVPYPPSFCEKCVLRHMGYCEDKNVCKNEGEKCDDGSEPITSREQCPVENAKSMATLRDFLELLPEYYIGSFGLSGISEEQKRGHFICSQYDKNEQACKITESCFWQSDFFSSRCAECPVRKQCNVLNNKEACTGCKYGKENCAWASILYETRCWSKSYVEAENSCIEQCKNAHGLCDETTCQGISNCWFKFDKTCHTCQDTTCDAFVFEDCEDAAGCGLSCKINQDKKTCEAMTQ